LGGAAASGKTWRLIFPERRKRRKVWRTADPEPFATILRAILRGLRKLGSGAGFCRRGKRRNVYRRGSGCGVLRYRGTAVGQPGPWVIVGAVLSTKSWCSGKMDGGRGAAVHIHEPTRGIRRRCQRGNLRSSHRRISSRARRGGAHRSVGKTGRKSCTFCDRLRLGDARGGRLRRGIVSRDVEENIGQTGGIGNFR